MQLECAKNADHEISVIVFGKAVFGKRGGGTIHVCCADCRKEMLSVDYRSDYTRKKYPLKKLKIEKDYDFKNPSMVLYIEPLSKPKDLKEIE